MPILDAEDPAPKRQRTFGGIKGGLSGQAKDDDGENAAHVGSGRVKSPWERSLHRQAESVNMFMALGSQLNMRR